MQRTILECAGRIIDSVHRMCTMWWNEMLDNAKVIEPKNHLNYSLQPEWRAWMNKLSEGFSISFFLSFLFIDLFIYLFALFARLVFFDNLPMVEILFYIGPFYTKIDRFVAHFDAYGAMNRSSTFFLFFFFAK